MSQRSEKKWLLQQLPENIPQEYLNKTAKLSGISEKIGLENIVDNTGDAIALAFEKYIDTNKCNSKLFIECKNK